MNDTYLEIFLSVAFLCSLSWNNIMEIIAEDSGALAVVVAGTGGPALVSVGSDE